jgi:aminoglycoside phosphotransferase (APT) family kinase protein
LHLVERLADGDEFPSEYPLLENYCLTHNDYRADNLLIDEGWSSAPIHVVDWQTLGVGNPMKDVAYFLGGCLLPNERAAIERDLLATYHASLLKAGVDRYSWERCWADYRRATFHGIMNAVAGTYFVTKTERGDQLFSIMAQRHARQALDVGADEFLN